MILVRLCTFYVPNMSATFKYNISPFHPVLRYFNSLRAPYGSPYRNFVKSIEVFKELSEKDSNRK